MNAIMIFSRASRGVGSVHLSIPQAWGAGGTKQVQTITVVGAKGAVAIIRAYKATQGRLRAPKVL